MFHSLEIVSTLHMFCLQNPNWTKTCVKPNTFATRSYKSILFTFNSALRAEKERRWIKFSQCSINLNVLTLPTKLKLKQKLYHTFAPRLKIRRWWLMRNWPIWTQWFHFVNIVHISQNHIFTPTTTITIVKTKRKISKVWLINVTPLHWTHFGKDCPTSISSITTLISLSATGFMTFESLFMDGFHCQWFA